MQKSQISFKIEPITETTLTTYDDLESAEDKPAKVRLDKWLWAARFYKTRALARTAIEQGRVLYDGQNTIPTKEIAVGSTVTLIQGHSNKNILIQKLSTRRRSSEEANELFVEVDAHKRTKFLRTGGGSRGLFGRRMALE